MKMKYEGEGNVKLNGAGGTGLKGEAPENRGSSWGRYVTCEDKGLIKPKFSAVPRRIGLR